MTSTPLERESSETRGLTTFGRSVATAGALLLLLGLAFGSYPYLLAALLLLGVAFAARGLRMPSLDVARRLSAEDVQAGDPLTVQTIVTSDDACGMTLHDAAPDAFALGEGRNLGAAWMPPGGRTALRFTLHAPRRGAHDVGPLRATAYDPLFLQSAIVADAGAKSEVVVHPRSAAAPRIRASSAWGRTMLPGGDRAVRGVSTNDFRELRPYARGDPLRQVNWKATARVSQDDLKLVVNDYEVEGKKAVWIFVDASPYTIGGTTSESAFDDLAQGALSVAAHYVDLGHRVGFTLYGNGAPRVLYADSGEKQERRIAAALASARPGEPGEGIASAVEATKGFLVREKPLVFVFTLAGRDADLSRALVTARALATPGRRPAAVVCVAPVIGDADATLAARMLALREKAALKGLERRGVTVVRYAPGGPPLVALLSKGAIR